MRQAIQSRLRISMGAGLIALVAATAAVAKNWEDWSAPASLESLPGSSPAINTPAVDGCASLSPDGLTIVFNSNRSGNFDLYSATRPNRSEGFGAPQRLPAPVNTVHNEACPTVATGRRLYFSSDREDPAYDLYVSQRGPDGWSTPENLGPNINTPGKLDESAAFYEDDEGREIMVFSTRSVNGSQGKIYESVNGGPKSLLAGGPPQLGLRQSTECHTRRADDLLRFNALWYVGRAGPLLCDTVKDVGSI